MKHLSLAVATMALVVTLGRNVYAESCENFTAYQEQTNGIPTHLLTAIARAESGRYDEQTGKTLAWPWTVTSPEGDVKYATKWEAIQAVDDLRRRGVTNIDVGCMQINLRYHPDAFGDLNTAFEPRNNVAYGAGVLLENFRRTGDWQKAVALYHSANPDLSGPYQARVGDLWQQARADAAYVSWTADGQEDPVAARAHLWDAARAWVDGHPTAYRWTYRSTVHRPFGSFGSSHVWYPRPVWYGDRDGTGDDHIFPIRPAGPWLPVGTSRFN